MEKHEKNDKLLELEASLNELTFDQQQATVKSVVESIASLIESVVSHNDCQLDDISKPFGNS